MTQRDIVIVGAGPAGLAVAIEAKKKGLSLSLIDQGCLVNAIFHFPADMTFFSTPDLMSIGDLLFVSPTFRPTRQETLHYYRQVAEHYDLPLHLYEKTTTIETKGERFAVTTIDAATEEKRIYDADAVVVATGYYDNPNMLDVPGEDLPHVSHYFTEAHPHQGRNVVVVGGQNSAVEAAMTLARTGAKVTLVHRGAELSSKVKYWIRPDIEKMIETGKVTALFDTVVTSIRPGEVDLLCGGQEKRIVRADALFALTGYHPDGGLLKEAGVEFDPESLAPIHDPATLETKVKGLFVAGSIVAGKNNNKVFIENSREHGKIILDALAPESGKEKGGLASLIKKLTG